MVCSGTTYAFVAASLIGAIAFSVPAAAQEHSAYSGMQISETMPMDAMAHDPAELSGDPDIDFARMTIPHHEGAIVMAEEMLAKGKDPEMRKLAEEVIAAQTKEIDFLKAWLAKTDAR